MATPNDGQRKWFWQEYPSTTFWCVVLLASILWWYVAAMHDTTRGVLLIAASLSSFVIGSLAGFVLSSYGEEKTTIGKIRDWMLGGLTGITLLKLGDVSSLLLKFRVHDNGMESALVASMAIVYVCLGFYFMYFERELILNLLLARTRAERGWVEGTVQAGIVIRHISDQLPASLLTGVDDAEKIVSEQEAASLGLQLNAADVKEFLDQSEQAAREGRPLDWDIVVKMAHLRYYRTYFEKNGEKTNEAKRALEWIVRALSLNPMHVDLTIKHADMLGLLNDYSASVNILQQLELRPDAPFLVKQWLGYFLLFIPGKEELAIKYSKEYLESFENDSGALINVACGYAQMYGEDQGSGQSDPSHRTHALDYLRKALRAEPSLRKRVREEWTQEGESFEALRDDPGFVALVRPQVLREQQSPVVDAA